MRLLQNLVFLLLVAGLLGCTTWALKERCEKTNWFEHARDVALSGRYLEEDGFIKECKGVDRTSSQQMDIGFKNGRERYCTYEAILRKGESGELMNFKMCDGLVMYQMQERYGAGLRKFCVADVGYSYGSSGKVYKNVCFKKEEEKFLPMYHRGRKEHLIKKIAQLNLQRTDISKALELMTKQMDSVALEISHLPSPQECSSRSVYNENTKQTEFVLICQEAGYIQYRRRTLYDEMNGLRSRASDLNRGLMKSIDDLREAESELTKIPTTATSLTPITPLSPADKK